MFLGSSVTFGFGSLGESFVDYLWKRDGVAAIKDAENGTTLVNQDDNSYVARFNEELNEEAPDMLVLQLSTNDATNKNNLGNFDTFDTQTVTGALEYIIKSAKDKWNCPILIYTNPYFENISYKKMVERTQELAEKWEVDLLDFYNNPEYKDQKGLYMADEIHPTRAGYLEKWLPKFENKLIHML